MRTIELYRKHKSGEISRDRFLYEVRRDKNLPWVTNITSYDDAVKILKNKGVISEAEISENFEVHYSNNNVRAAKKYNNKNKAIEFMKDMIANSQNLQDIAIYKAGPEFNSTADTNAVVAWWGKEGSFLANKSEKDPKLADKKMSLNEAAGDVDTKGIYDIKMRNGEVIAKGVKFYPNGEWYQETETGGIKLGGKIPDGASVTRVGETLKEADENVSTDPAVDRVNPYFLKKGVQMLLDKEKELTNDSYIKALNKAALMLQKNPHAFDKEMFANAEDVEKADAKLETQEVKKANHKDKANEMKKVKVKALKEAAIGELKDYLKKKEQINEDSHYKHHVGSEVHTPDGEGKIIEIVGGTFTVEMKDGTHKDFQINTIDHFTQKAQEELPVQKPQPDQTVKDMWANWKGNTFGGMVGDPEHFKKPLDLSKLKEYIAKHKDDKEKMGKLKEAIKKLKEAKGVIVPTSANDMQVSQIVKKAFPNATPGQQIDIIRK